jgi:hypothetical protein
MNEKPDFKIDLNGVWYHEGSPIKREALAKLFSDRALKIDKDGNYWLATPFEKYPVEVEDVPFVIVDYKDEKGALTFRTNMEETTPERIEMRGEIPYVHVRDGLYARINRAVYYNLIEEFGAGVFESR